MPKPVCVKCRLFYKIKRGGVAIEEGRPLGGDAWGPYKLWMADLYECKGCGAQLVTGFGRERIVEHYQPEYAATVEKFRPLLRVNDC
jgi:hypothetical protein